MNSSSKCNTRGKIGGNPAGEAVHGVVGKALVFNGREGFGSTLVLLYFSPIIRNLAGKVY